MTDSPPPLCIYVLSFGSSFFFILRKGSPGDDPFFFPLSCQHQRGHRHPLLVILARPPDKKKSNFAQPKLTQQIVARPTPPFQKRTFVTRLSLKYVWWTRNVHRSNNIPWLHLQGGRISCQKKQRAGITYVLIVEALLSLSLSY